MKVDKEDNEKLNPWTGILSKPERSLDYLWRNQPEDNVHRLLILTGVVVGLALRIPDWMYAPIHPIGVMVQILLFAPLGGVLFGYLLAAVLKRLSGYGQAAKAGQLSKVLVAWTQIPFMIAWIVGLSSYILLEAAGLAHSKDGIWLGKGTIGWIPILLFGLIWIWAVSIRIRGIAALFEKSKGKASLIWLIGTVLTYVPAFLVILSYLAIFVVTTSMAE